MIAALVPLFLEAALRALLAALAVWAGLRLLRVGNVLVQKAAWGLILIAALAMPLLPRWQGLPLSAALRLPSIARSQPPATAPTPSPAQLSNRTQQHSAYPLAIAPAFELTPTRVPAPSVSRLHLHRQASSAPPVNPVFASAPSKQPSEAISKPSAPAANPTPIRLASLAWLLYLAVVSALLLRILLGLISALKLWLTATPIAHQAAHPRLRLRFSPRVASPVNIGSGIVLPAAYTAWDEEKLRVVLAHERSHVRQGDFYLQLLAAIYASLFWFSPLGWWLKRKLYELGEAISDRAGLQEAASRSSYAQLLLEFAALPRPTLTGVAMARTSHLSQRIERLLNESSFRQAFAAGGRRALLAILLVPAALLAASALVRVEAAASPSVHAAVQAPLAGQSTPAQGIESGAQPQAPAPAPAPPANSSVPASAPKPPEPAGPAPSTSPLVVAVPHPSPDPAPQVVPPLPPDPNINPGIVLMLKNPELNTLQKNQIKISAANLALLNAFDNIPDRRFYFKGGPSYAIVGDPGDHVRFSGDWQGDRLADVENARKIAHGHFLLFQHEGKTYVIDDPAIVAQVEAMNQPLQDLSSQMRALARQQRDFRQQQWDLRKKMSQDTIQTPDLTKELADLNATLATLQARQGGTINQVELSDLTRKLAQVEGRLGALQGKLVMQQLNAEGGPVKFSEEQAKIAGQMGKLGAQIGQTASENEEKFQSIITDSLTNGKARPIEEPK